MSIFHPDEEPKFITKDVPTRFCSHCEYRLEMYDRGRGYFFCACSVWKYDNINDPNQWLDAEMLSKLPKDMVGVVWSHWRSPVQPRPYKDREDDDNGIVLD